MKKLYLLACDYAELIFISSIVGILLVMAASIGVNMAGIEFGR